MSVFFVGGLCVFLTIFVPFQVDGHGYMLDPPSRSSLWRVGFGDAPKNYNDNELFCGGRAVQFNTINNGRCGECGDEWSRPRPRDNDEGGLYWKGIIGQSYTVGSYIRTEVKLTANHAGFFEFKLCPEKRSLNELVSQECFDRYPLRLKDGSYRYPVEAGVINHYPIVKLPDGVKCSYCVIQWTYTTGNSWGICPNGTGTLGCGDQETFRNCADVTIL